MGYVFGSIFIIIYIMWSYDSIKDLIVANKEDKSISIASAWWIAITILGILSLIGMINII